MYTIRAIFCLKNSPITLSKLAIPLFILRPCNKDCNANSIISPQHARVFYPRSNSTTVQCTHHGRLEATERQTWPRAESGILSCSWPDARSHFTVEQQPLLSVRFDSMARVFSMFLWRFLLGFPRTTQSRKISKTMSFYKQRYNGHFSGGSITLVFYDGANAITFPWYFSFFFCHFAHREMPNLSCANLWNHNWSRCRRSHDFSIYK